MKELSDVMDNQKIINLKNWNQKPNNNHSTLILNKHIAFK